MLLQLRKPIAIWSASKKRGQRVKGGDSPLLLHSCDTLPRLLSSALGLPAKGRYRPATAVRDEGHKNDQMMD